jgi:hypothetical protein
MELISLSSYYSAPITFFIGSTFSSIMAGVTVTPLQSMDYDIIVNTSDVPGNGTVGVCTALGTAVAALPVSRMIDESTAWSTDGVFLTPFVSGRRMEMCMSP